MMGGPFPVGARVATSTLVTPPRDRAHGQFWLALPLIAVIVAIIAVFAFTRSFMTYGTETDYLGGFVPEAYRILSGGPLIVDFHPPLYSFVLLAVWLVLREWFVTGLWVSVVSGVGLVFASYFLFRRLLGTAGALGAVAGLLASPVFIEYSAAAASDVFFTFLYVSAFTLATAALQTERRYLWLGCGVVIGFVLLTRTNGLAAVVLFLAPLLTRAERREKASYVGMIVLGVGIPVIVWAIYAALTGSPLMPTQTYGSLAQTFYGEDPYRSIGTVREMFQRRFHGLGEVLAYDPVRIIKVYVRDLLVFSRRIFYRDVLLSFPMNQLALGGMVFLLFRPLNRTVVLLLMGFVMHVLLINMKAFEARYYLFLVPLFGAAVGLLATDLLSTARTGIARRLAVAVIALLGIAGFAQSLVAAYPELHREDALIADLITGAHGIVQPNAVILSLRPQHGFYLHAASESPAQIDSLPQLELIMQDFAKKGPVYLYIGADERESWSVANALDRSTDTPAWLVPVAASRRWGWRLYEYSAAAESAQDGALLVSAPYH